MPGGLASYVDLSSVEPRWCKRCGKMVPRLRAHMLHVHCQQWSYYLYESDSKLRSLELHEHEGGTYRKVAP